MAKTRTTWKITYTIDNETDYIELDAPNVLSAIAKFDVFGAVIVGVIDINFDY